MFTVFDLVDMLDGSMIDDKHSILVIKCDDKTVLYNKTVSEFMHENTSTVDDIEVNTFKFSSTCLVIYV